MVQIVVKKSGEVDAEKGRKGAEGAQVPAVTGVTSNEGAFRGNREYNGFPPFRGSFVF